MFYEKNSNRKRKPAIFLNSFTVCSSCKQKFFICPFADKETNKSYTFANRLNGLAHLCAIHKNNFDFGNLTRGLYFGPKTIFIPPPFWKLYFSPSRDTSLFHYHRGLFALILPYFAIILPFYFPFSHFLSPFFLFLPTFFLFLLLFPPFSFRLFIFFPPNDIGWYFFSPRGGGVFSNI